MARRVLIGLLVIGLLCAFTFTEVHGAEKLVSADDDEFENDMETETRPPAGGIPIVTPEQPKKQPSKSLQQDDSMIYDADEFEGIETIKKPVIEVQEVEEEPTPEAEKKPPPKPRFGILEISYISFIVVFLLNYFAGKKTNEKIATAWGQTFQSFFSANFVKFNDEPKFRINKDSAHIFSVSCSGGRSRCIGAVFTLDLNKRHDLTSYLFGILSPHKDTLTIEVAMNNTQPFCFGLAKKKEAKQFLKAHKEIADFAPTPRVLPKLPNFVIHTDSNEVTDDVLTREVIDILAANEALFSSLSYEDMSTTYVGYKTILKIVYRVPPVNDMKKLTDLMRLAFVLIDAFAGASITKSVMLKNEALRKKAAQTQEKTDHEIREEIAQKKKQDRLIAERAAYEKMSPDAQRKYDEKEEKRRLKAKQSKVKVVYS